MHGLQLFLKWFKENTIFPINSIFHFYLPKQFHFKFHSQFWSSFFHISVILSALTWRIWLFRITCPQVCTREVWYCLSAHSKLGRFNLATLVNQDTLDKHGSNLASALERHGLFDPAISKNVHRIRMDDSPTTYGYVRPSSTSRLPHTLPSITCFPQNKEAVKSLFVYFRLTCRNRGQWTTRSDGKAAGE